MEPWSGGRPGGGDDGAEHPKTRNRVTNAIEADRPDRGRRSFSIARKLGTAMTVLLLAVVVVLGFEIVEIERETAAVRRQTALAVSADGPSRLLTSLQNERSWATVNILGQGDAAELIVEGDEETRRRTDEALAGFEELLAHSPEETRRAFAPAMDGLEADLESVRARVDGNTAPRNLDNLPFSNEIFDSYSEIVEPFFAGTAEVATSIDRRDLLQGAELIDLTNRQVETLGLLGREVATASLLSPGGIDGRDEVAEVSALQGQFVRLAHQIRSTSTGLYAGAGDDELFVGLTEAMVEQVEAAIAGNFSVDELLATIAPPPEDTYPGYGERVASLLRDRAEQLSDDAARRERTYVALVALSFVLALAIMLVVARSITGSLRSLAQQMLHAAHHALRQAVATVLQSPLGEDVHVPQVERIAVATDDEVNDLATAMNAVQDAVVALAVEQAVLRRNLADSFVSLGRRNQNLLSRQLDFITHLQRNEADPDVLGHLFRLDHLATRMRRNAESLLVLAGNESPRKWRTPVRIADVVRAAVGEVEQYQRVHLSVFGDFTVLGNVAVDLAHLLAELIENALLFSPPDQPVEVRGMPQPPGYSLAVVDTGVGMTPGEIDQANRRLAAAESFTVAPSKYLGHYVAGHLAARHGVLVWLQGSPGPGITAIVRLPQSLSPMPRTDDGPVLGEQRAGAVVPRYL